MTNLKKNQAETNSSLFESVLANYFDKHSASETEDQMRDLLQAWISAETETTHSNTEIANMVFFVSNVTIMVRKVADLDFNAKLGIDEASEARLFICQFFDQFGPDYPEELLNEALQAWICPYDYGSRSLTRVADAVSAFNLVGGLVRRLEVLNNEFQMEGGVTCA